MTWACPADKGSAVYLNVGQLETDARPKVVLVGEVKDRAGNVRTEGTINSAIDGLAPIVTATPSVDIAAELVTVTVTSSERLGLNPPSSSSRPPKPVKGEDPETPLSRPDGEVPDGLRWIPARSQSGRARRPTPRAPLRSGTWW